MAKKEQMVSVSETYNFDLCTKAPEHWAKKALKKYQRCVETSIYVKIKLSKASNNTLIRPTKADVFGTCYNCCMIRLIILFAPMYPTIGDGWVQFNDVNVYGVFNLSPIFAS